MCFIYSALGGDLHRHCIAYDSDEPASSRSEREVVFLLRQILEGVKHMHDQDYVHLKSILIAIIKKTCKIKRRLEVGSDIPLISDHHPDTHLGFSSAAGGVMAESN